VAFAGGDYEIRIKGRLSDSLLAAFEGLTTTVQPVATVLHGPVQTRRRSTACWTGSSRWAWSWLSSGSYRHQPNPSTNRQIRRLVLSVHLVSLSAVCAAQVKGRVQPSPDNPSGDGWWTATRTTTESRAIREAERRASSLGAHWLAHSRACESDDARPAVVTPDRKCLELRQR
jgi:hypothetical protein